MLRDDVIASIVSAHRKRRFTMNMQTKVENALGAYVRTYATDWAKKETKAEREVEAKKAVAIIAAARASKGRPRKGTPEILEIVMTTDISLAPTRDVRARYEATMVEMAALLPAASFVDNIRGAGLLGLATIIGETGDLDKYETISRVW